MNTKNKNYIFTVMILCLTACSATYPVAGQVDKTKERFLGTATVSMLETDASISITTDNGAKCSGRYPRPQASAGGVSASGKFNCDDGRVGSFTFAGTSQGGKGFGKFNNGNKFTFIYGGNGADETNAALGASLQDLGESMKSAYSQPPTISTPQLYVPTHPVHCTTSPSIGGSYVETNCY